MYYGLKFGDLWREALKDDEGCYGPRMLSDDAEREFWKKHMLGKKEFLVDDYAADIWNAVREILRERSFGNVLEIGPGWGNYSLKLASSAQTYSCVDLSPDVLEYVRHVLHGHGYDVRTYCAKWEDFDAEGYDLVFGFNCFYRMRRIEHALQKIHHAAKYRIIGMTSGPEQEYYPELERRLGVQIRYHKFDYIHLANILYELGIDSNIRIVELKRLYEYGSMTEAVESVMGKIKASRSTALRVGTVSSGIIPESVEEIVAPFFTRNASGKYQMIHHFRAGILYW